MKLEFGYGKTVQTVEVPDKNVQAVLTANPMEHKFHGAEAVREALKSPIGTDKLSEMVRPGQKVVIITSDVSRPLPSYDVLPAVLDELKTAGVPMEDVTVVFALGSHRKQTEEEQRRLAGDAVFEEVRCIDSTPEDCVHLGNTKNGTPIDISRVVAEADSRI